MDRIRSSIRISFIVPAYNEEGYLAWCLKSIFRTIGEREDCEVIVVNNASTDRTRSIAENFSRVRIVDEAKKGLVLARQAGYLAARGELIANIDADVRLRRGWLIKVLQEFDRDPTLVCLSGPYHYYDLSFLSQILMRASYAFAYFFYLLSRLLSRGATVAIGGNSVIRRSALDKVSGYDTSIDFFGEDTSFAARLAGVGRVKLLWGMWAWTSARRFKKEGILKLTFKYNINYLWMLLFKRPFHTKSEDYR